MSDLISKDAVFGILRYLDVNFANSFDWHTLKEVRTLVENEPSADVRKNIHGKWLRMSDLPEDKDDRYKCSNCGNVVHHSNGVNLYTFNSWCGACGSLNNSLLAGLESRKAESEV